jgi:hypothetical protein
VYEKHQCYACGILASSAISDREVTFFSQTQLYYPANKQNFFFSFGVKAALSFKDEECYKIRNTT